MKTVNIKNQKVFVLFLAVCSLFVISCDSDDDPLSKPEISDFELGLGDNRIGYIGSDLHIEAEVEAENKISTIMVEIHMEDEAAGWQFEKTWTDFNGLLNTNFHKHIDIPANATAGIYHFHFVVTDMAGNQTEWEAEDLQVKAIDDSEKPTIDISSSPANNASFADGETISLAGKVTDNISLAGMLVALVRTEDNIADADVKGGNKKVIVMLHTHDFGKDPDAYTFNASIKVGAEKDNNMTPASIEGENAWRNGDYYILLRVKDQSGNWAFSQKYPITVNLP
ncbi:MAG: DUF4625 domain-containing protein [Flavobacteriaceae bacterium]|nr:DUF4625 domain-containing protein [Flavobacteriaceae bacterium]